MSRCLSQGMTEGSSPADLPPSARPRSHGPTAFRRAHTPVRTNNASPAETLTPAFSFPCLQVLDIDRRTRLQIRNAFEPRNVEQDAARENPILEVVDGILLRGRSFNTAVRIGLVAVVEHAVVVDVRKQIQVRVGDPVVADPEPVVADGKHLVLVGKGLSTALTVSASLASDTENPPSRDAAASLRFAGVIRLRAPIWSSLPQRPQLERSFFQLSYSAAVTTRVGAVWDDSC